MWQPFRVGRKVVHVPAKPRLVVVCWLVDGASLQELFPGWTVPAYKRLFQPSLLFFVCHSSLPLGFIPEIDHNFTGVRLGAVLGCCVAGDNGGWRYGRRWSLRPAIRAGWTIRLSRSLYSHSGRRPWVQQLDTGCFSAGGADPIYSPCGGMVAHPQCEAVLSPLCASQDYL